MDPNVVTLPASPMDWVNRIAGQQDSNALLGMVAVLERPLPHATLHQAVGRLLRSHPILASRFIDSDPPVWALPSAAVDPDAHLRDLSLVDRTLEEGLAEYLKSDKGDSFSVSQCHGPDNLTFLVLGVRHALTDGAGLKQLWDEFIRSCVGSREDAVGPSDGSVPTRQADVLFSSLGAPETWRPAVQAAEERQKAARSLLRPDPSTLSPVCDRVSLTVRTPDETEGLLAACRANHATPTAWLAAEILAVSPGRALTITVDLRRYLPEGTEFGVGNLSGTELVGFPDLPEHPADRDPAAMLPQIADVLRRDLAAFPGVGSACLQQSLTRLGYRKTREYLLAAGRAAGKAGVAAPMLSNLGVLPAHSHIADVRILSCFFLPPSFRPPAVMVGAVTWNGCLATCSSIGFRPPDGA